MGIKIKTNKKRKHNDQWPRALEFMKFEPEEMPYMSYMYLFNERKVLKIINTRFLRSFIV